MWTTIILGSYVVLFLLGLTLWAAFLVRGLRWGKVRDISASRVVLAMLLTIVLQVGWESLMAALAHAAPRPEPVPTLQWLGLAGSVALSWLSILIVFRTRVVQAVQAWLMTLVPAIVILPLLLFVWRPLYIEAFISPTSAMAPTLLGQHVSHICSVCGEPNYCSDRQTPPERMICSQFHVDDVAADEVDAAVHQADRFLVAKFLKPQRWDVIAFESPNNPNQKYVMRLVGLPGETMEIRDGGVWADGERLEVPSELEGLEYLAQPPNYYGPLWATRERPASLGEAQYFVLGDFSAQSNDSRLWETGAKGFPPYAVPQSHLVGVVTHIYWPPWRMRALK